MTKNKLKVGIVGQGFVGSALKEGLVNERVETSTYDKFSKAKSSVENIRELCHASSVIFVCVPSPMKKDGSCDISIVESVIAEISEHAAYNVAVIKSTVPPGTTNYLNEKYGRDNFAVMFNPEFLTEANAVNDFKNQDRIIIGTPRQEWTTAAARVSYSIKKTDWNPATLVHAIYMLTFPDVSYVELPATSAEMVKYTANTFLATKVSFANEMFQICKGLNIDYEQMINAAKLDKRLGDSHWKVPGPMPADDGSGKLLLGWAGSCFVKDVNALRVVGDKLDVDTKVLDAAWEKNLEVRPQRDWEYLKGRAVTNE